MKGMLKVSQGMLVHLFVWTIAHPEVYSSAGSQSSDAQLSHFSNKQAFFHAKHYKKDYRRLKKQEGAVKLVGGERGAFEGNVEILHKGRWGNICDDEWDELEARVVCRQLGYEASGALPTTNSYFGKARRQYWMDNIYCDGTEPELSKCRFDGWGRTDCEGSEAAGVICDNFGDNLRTNSNRISTASLNVVQSEKWKIRIKDIHQQGLAVRLTNFQEGRVEVKLGDADWGVVCGDGWSFLEASVVCRQLGLGYAAKIYQTSFFDDNRLPMAISGIKCNGDERSIAECLHDTVLECPGVGENVASVSCTPRLADLVLDSIELQRTAHLEDRQLFWLQCAMEENCVASQAYQLQRETEHWHLETRRLLRFTARILNAGTADFRPSVPKHLWEWHMCHMHYHSMEVFATFDIIDSKGRRVAEGHKASFCLEDNQCIHGVKPRYRCANYGDQGISVNCSDIYKYNIDCQWIDISELTPGSYTFKVAVNPEMKVGEMSFNNNAATCKLLYTETFAKVHSCVMGRP